MDNTLALCVAAVNTYVKKTHNESILYIDSVSEKKENLQEYILNIKNNQLNK